jgi:hypothetical protein
MALGLNTGFTFTMPDLLKRIENSPNNAVIQFNEGKISVKNTGICKTIYNAFSSKQNKEIDRQKSRLGLGIVEQALRNSYKPEIADRAFAKFGGGSCTVVEARKLNDEAQKLQNFSNAKANLTNQGAVWESSVSSIDESYDSGSQLYLNIPEAADVAQVGSSTPGFHHNLVNLVKGSAPGDFGKELSAIDEEKSMPDEQPFTNNLLPRENSVSTSEYSVSYYEPTHYNSESELTFSSSD